MEVPTFFASINNEETSLSTALSSKVVGDDDIIQLQTTNHLNTDISIYNWKDFTVFN